MPAVCNDLFDVSLDLHRRSEGTICGEPLLLNRFDVSGEFALEVCCGEAIVTIGLLMAKVPCIKPWDTKYGENFDVLSNGHVLISLASSSHLSFVHLAPPCQSATWGRFPALRTWSCPAGIPNLSGSQLPISEPWECSSQILYLVMCGSVYCRRLFLVGESTIVVAMGS